MRAAFVIGGAASGVGKTTVSLGPIAALRRRGLRRRASARVKRFGAAVLVALALALSAVTTDAAITLRDLLGRDVQLPAPPARIVSLVPSATEILFALGAEDRLVGVTRFCDYPDAARKKASVGDMLAPSLEAIAALKPDLVIATDEGNREETFTHLRRLGIPIFLVHAQRVADAVTVIDRIGEITGRREVARALIQTMDDRIAVLKRAVAPFRRPRVLYAVWPEPLIVPGRRAIVTELIALAGGESITATDGEDYPRFSLEAAVARNPEVIVLATHGAGTPPGAREKFERFASLAAVRSGRVHAVNGDLMHRYTPRLVEGLELLVRAIHPEALK